MHLIFRSEQWMNTNEFVRKKKHFFKSICRPFCLNKIIFFLMCSSLVIKIKHDKSEKKTKLKWKWENNKV